MTTRRGRWMRIALACASLAAGLAIAEVLARRHLGERFHPGSDAGNPETTLGRFDADVGWTLRPDTSTRVVAEVFEYRLTTNSRGWRDAETPFERAGGKRRVVLLGDSVAWGWGVDDGRAFADLVERRVPDLEVVNLAVPGYGTDQQFLVLEREGFAYAPDAVLLCFILNDVVGNDSAIGKPRLARTDAGVWVLENHPVVGEPLRFAGSWQRALRPVTRHSALARLLVSGGLAPPGRKARVEHTYESACGELVRPEAVTHEWLARLARACAERGIPLLALAVAHKHDRWLYDTAFPIPSEASQRPFRTLLARRLEEAGLALGFATVSVDDAMLARRLAGETLHCGDGHLNERGNEVVADVLAPWLDARVVRR